VHLAISRVELEGEVLFAGVLHDLSESKHFENILTQQNRELSAANEELEQFAYVASHDLKTPLRAIDNLIDWIMDDMQGICIPSEVQHNLGRLRERSQYMEKMIKELLAFSRAGRYAYPGEPVNVKQLVEQIVFELAPPAGMHIRIEDSLPVLNTPKPPLELVLRNLISNAVKYHDMPEGNISISLQSGDDVYTFSVTDDGPGIEPQYHAKVFQIFQTLQPKSQSNSTGMGLALVKRVVEGYGCSIRLMQNTSSRGSTFEFGWPAHWQEEPYNTEADNSSSSDEQDAA
jgi:signal transduction histidine kinase